MSDRNLVLAREMVEALRGRSPDAVRLGCCVSLAARVEPELLRHARLTLLPGVESGVEADLWLSELVEAATPVAMLFLPEAAAVLREELAADPELLDRAWDVLREVHRDAPPALRVEEELTWLSLSSRPGAAERIEQLLESVLQAILQEDRTGLVHWAARALPRLPEAAARSRAGWMLAVGAGARLGGRKILSGELPAGARAWLDQVLPPDAPRVQLGVRMLRHAVEIGPPREGAHALEVPAVLPLEISWRDAEQERSEQVAVGGEQIRLLPVGAGPVRLRTLLGEEFELRPHQRYFVRVDLASELPTGDDTEVQILVSGSRLEGGTEAWLDPRARATLQLVPVSGFVSTHGSQVEIDPPVTGDVWKGSLGVLPVIPGDGEVWLCLGQEGSEPHLVPAHCHLVFPLRSDSSRLPEHEECVAVIPADEQAGEGRGSATGRLYAGIIAPALERVEPPGEFRLVPRLVTGPRGGDYDPRIFHQSRLVLVDASFLDPQLSPSGFVGEIAAHLRERSGETVVFVQHGRAVPEWLRSYPVHEYAPEHPEEARRLIASVLEEMLRSPRGEGEPHGREEPAATEEAVASPALSMRRVTASRLNVRADPSARNPPIAVLPRDAPVEVLEEVGDWYRIRFGDREGFASAQYLAVPPPGGAPATDEPGVLVEQDHLHRIPLRPPVPIPITRDMAPAVSSAAGAWNSFGGLLQAIGELLKISPATAVAVWAVEADGPAFGRDGRMIIRFENHVFYDHWGKKHPKLFDEHFSFDREQKWRSHRCRLTPEQPWAAVHDSQAREWEVFGFARRLDETAAMSSLSMGAPRIMGFHHGRLGYGSVQEMFGRFQQDARFQILGLFDLIRGSGKMLSALRAGRLDEFARGYAASAQTARRGKGIGMLRDAIEPLLASSSRGPAAD